MDNRDASRGLVTGPGLVLRMIARSLESSVSRCNVLDGNVARQPFALKVSWDAVPVDAFTQRVKSMLRGRTVELRSNHQFVKVQVSGRFKNEAISINRLDRNFLTKPTEFMIASGRLRVYASNPELQRHESVLLSSRRAQELVASIITNREDSVHLYSNKVVCYLFEPRAADVVLRILHDMVSLAECLEIGGSESEKGRLPAQFSSLTPLADRWCLSDDTEREDAIEAASEDDLRNLIAIVKPRLEEINAFLDENSTPDDEAAALGTLAECAVEAEMHLADRRS